MHAGRDKNKSMIEALHIPKRLEEETIPVGTKVQINDGLATTLWIKAHILGPSLTTASVIRSTLPPTQTKPMGQWVR
jgi:hypothetical protein